MSSAKNVSIWVVACTLASVSCDEEEERGSGTDGSALHEPTRPESGTPQSVDAAESYKPEDSADAEAAHITADATTHGEALPDAAADDRSGEGCFRPFSAPTGDTDIADARGCACDPGADAAAGYCVAVPAADAGSQWRYLGIACSRGQWTYVQDGPCDTRAPISEEQCVERGGVVVYSTADNDAPMRSYCDLGYRRLGRLTGAGQCCQPLSVTPADCVAAGYNLADPTDGGPSTASCPDGWRLRAYLEHDALSAGGACCEKQESP